MYKALKIFLFFVILSGCSVLRDQNKKSGIIKDYFGFDNINELNLTNNSFYIQKAEVEVITENEKKIFLASVKFCKPDTFLISVRSRAGIEAVRAFITDDTLLINDRLNKILYYGSGKEIGMRFGYSREYIPALFGDLINNNKYKKSISKCENDEYTINLNFELDNLKYLYNCNSGKLSDFIFSNANISNPVIIKYFKSEIINTARIYSEILILNLKDIKSVKINYSKIEYPYNGFIEFLPGKNYELARIR